ncbi:MAG: hypothetical protein V3S95_00490 [Alphaproteobacteria bacterium]
MSRIALLAGLLVAFPAMAQESAPCVKRSDFLKHLSSNYDEAPVAMGVTASGRVLEVVASDHGSWTIIVTMPNGISCGIASGESWEHLTAPISKGPKA